MSIEPAFSVVIPAYNAAQTLAEALDSVFDQKTDLPFEVVLVDDGSTDSTPQIARSYRGLRYVAKKNGGEASARNAGLRAARSPIVTFLDADDRALPGRFAMQIPYMLDNPFIDVSFGNMTMEDEPRGNYVAQYGLVGSEAAFTEIPDAFERLMAVGCFLSPSTVAARRLAMMEAGGFNETRHYSCDYAMWLRIAAAEGRFAFTGRALSWYRTQLDTRLSRSSRTHLGLVQTMREAILEFGPQLGPDAYEKAFARYARCVDLLLRQDWADGGRERVRSRMADLAPLLPDHVKRKYLVASLIPGIFPRTGRFIKQALSS